jgi:hypothetical protein
MESPTDWKIIGNFLAVSEKNLQNWKFKLNIIDGITDEIIKKY